MNQKDAKQEFPARHVPAERLCPPPPLHGVVHTLPSLVVDSWLGKFADCRGGRLDSAESLVYRFAQEHGSFLIIKAAACCFV